MDHQHTHTYTPFKETIAMASHHQGVCFKLCNRLAYHILGLSPAYYLLDLYLQEKPMSS